tara:strand:- start:381 stop:533 length:153 start_codon:yes stop_codon:yes gene_type:complete
MYLDAVAYISGQVADAVGGTVHVGEGGHVREVLGQLSQSIAAHVHVPVLV